MCIISNASLAITVYEVTAQAGDGRSNRKLTNCWMYIFPWKPAMLFIGSMWKIFLCMAESSEPKHLFVSNTASWKFQQCRSQSAKPMEHQKQTRPFSTTYSFPIPTRWETLTDMLRSRSSSIDSFRPLFEPERAFGAQMNIVLFPSHFSLEERLKAAPAGGCTARKLMSTLESGQMHH